MHCMDSGKDASVSVRGPISEAKPKDYALLARLVIREGKPFYSSALQAGYADTVARRGLRALVEDSKPFSEALKRESESYQVSIGKLKPLAVNRLYFELLDPESRDAMRAIEIAGRFKETDWFVRSTELNLGVFVGLSDSSAGETTPSEDTKE